MNETIDSWLQKLMDAASNRFPNAEIRLKTVHRVRELRYGVELDVGGGGCFDAYPVFLGYGPPWPVPADFLDQLIPRPKLGNPWQGAGIRRRVKHSPRVGVAA